MPAPSRQVECPECGLAMRSRGLQGHLRWSHGTSGYSYVPDSSDSRDELGEVDSSPDMVEELLDENERLERDLRDSRARAASLRHELDEIRRESEVREKARESFRADRSKAELHETLERLEDPAVLRAIRQRLWEQQGAVPPIQRPLALPPAFHCGSTTCKFEPVAPRYSKARPTESRASLMFD